MKIILIDDKKKVHLEFEQVPGMNLEHIFDRAFKYFDCGCCNENAENKVVINRPKSSVAETKQSESNRVSVKEQAIAIVQRAKEREQSVSRPRQLPLIGAEPTLSQNLGEKFAAAVGKKQDESPEFWATGIKTNDDGTKRYKCYYRCECGSKGNHYIQLGTESVKCYDCQTQLKVEQATPFGKEIDGEWVPERDPFGNFFTAFIKCEG
ncbi:hypothetical protein P9E76_01655 [Schinkia azotoformans]|uniref:Phage protein n=1 Tax=Schinkia azotoformans LMG 9581 TaxID=1131731 RepID=K6C9P1_SCHAZ|nr:hypothetical protein [Schinkia azotoformans]EKN67855.1 Phage protein [Schinkia azotoformans LMG 9581]MEC1637380.1 hypothetical protein [Schinkia azotoformans]MEC1943784.1 hypothetical protein [Schinkia azotoformans]